MKRSKSAVNYRLPRRLGRRYWSAGGRKCGNCAHKPSKHGLQCSMVEGEIAFHGTCDLWRAWPQSEMLARARRAGLRLVS